MTVYRLVNKVRWEYERHLTKETRQSQAILILCLVLYALVVHVFEVLEPAPPFLVTVVAFMLLLEVSLRLARFRIKKRLFGNNEEEARALIRFARGDPAS